MNNTHVEQNFRGVGDLFELLQCFVEFIVVVPREGGNPGFYFLWSMSVAGRVSKQCFAPQIGFVTNLFQRHRHSDFLVDRSEQVVWYCERPYKRRTSAPRRVEWRRERNEQRYEGSGRY